METKPLKTSSGNNTGINKSPPFTHKNAPCGQIDKIEVASTACSSQQLASDSSPTDNSASNEVTSTSILETIKNQKEWVKTIVFESDGRIVAATVMPFEGEVE
jgi:hypothetical protein